MCCGCSVLHRCVVLLSGKLTWFCFSDSDFGMKLKTACFCPQASETPGVLKNKVESAFKLYLKAERIQNHVFQIYPVEFKDERDRKTTFEDGKESGTAATSLTPVIDIHVQIGLRLRVKGQGRSWPISCLWGALCEVHLPSMKCCTAIRITKTPHSAKPYLPTCVFQGGVSNSRGTPGGFRYNVDGHCRTLRHWPFVALFLVSEARRSMCVVPPTLPTSSSSWGSDQPLYTATF